MILAEGWDLGMDRLAMRIREVENCWMGSSAWRMSGEWMRVEQRVWKVDQSALRKDHWVGGSRGGVRGWMRMGKWSLP
jgi:hypothetical protein